MEQIIIAILKFILRILPAKMLDRMIKKAIPELAKTLIELTEKMNQPGEKNQLHEGESHYIGFVFPQRNAETGKPEIYVSLATADMNTRQIKRVLSGMEITDTVNNQDFAQLHTQAKKALKEGALNLSFLKDTEKEETEKTV